MTTLHAQALFDDELARSYLRDQGYPADDGDMLRLHINAVTGFIQRFTGRNRLRYSATPIVEVRDGRGSSWFYTREAPIKSLTEIQTHPMVSGSGETITGPGTATSNDDMWVDQQKGRVELIDRVLPEGAGTVQITYTAGWDAEGDNGATATEPSLAALQVIALEALLRKWQRWVEKRVGIAARSSNAGSTTYSTEDFSAEVLAELKRYRRTLAR